MSLNQSLNHISTSLQAISLEPDDNKRIRLARKANHQHSDLYMQLTEQQARMDELELRDTHERDELRAVYIAEVKKLKEAHSAELASKNQAKSDIRRLNQTIASLRDENKKEMTGLRSQLKISQDLLSISHSQNIDLREASKQQAEKAHGEALDLQTQLEDASTSVSNITHEVESLRKDLESRRHTTSGIEADLVSIKSRNEELESILSLQQPRAQGSE